MVTEKMLSTREVKSLPRRMISLSGSMCPTKHSLSGLPLDGEGEGRDVAAVVGSLDGDGVLLALGGRDQRIGFR